MSNSFYYFFSATPQVLGGILALFGVFTIFKIQNLRLFLIGSAQSILHEASRTKPELSSDISMGIEGGIRKSDTGIIYNWLSKVNLDSLKPLIITYFQGYKTLRRIIIMTEIWSIITSITITFCLIVLPFGHFLLTDSQTTYILFSIALFLIVLSFSGLTYILITALRE